MSLKDQYRIEPIANKTAMRYVVMYHYLHRAAPCSIAYGLIEAQTNKIAGVICYGTPSSAPLRSGICGKDQSLNVIELTRLWIEDDTPKNSESYLIGNTVRRLNKEIVVSFADQSTGHCGVVYQATNWIYTGLSAKRTDWTISGIDKHGQTIADKYTAKEVREKYGDKFSIEDRPRKHRYIFFNASPTRKKKLMAALKYPILPYPKKETPTASSPGNTVVLVVKNKFEQSLF